MDIFGCKYLKNISDRISSTWVKRTAPTVRYRKDERDGKGH